MKGKLSILLLAVCVAGFALGIAELFKLRFEAGDVYPAYSSLRNDPLGTSAFYESLERMPDMTARRDFSANDDLPDGPDTAYLHLAGDRDEWSDLPEGTFKAVDQFVKSGGRLVVTLYPASVHGFRSRVGPGGIKLPPGTGTNTVPIKPTPPIPKPKNPDSELFPTVSLAERWGLGFDVRGLKQGASEAYEPVEVLNADDPTLPASMAWHSGVIFTNLDPAWRVIYARGKDPVLIERKMGRGSVVFSTDSFFLSNEALVRDRQAALLAWLVGPSRRVVFDEAHFGIVQEAGIAMLVRKYKLGWFMAGLFILAALFIWKNSLPLAPPTAGAQAAAFVTGKDSAAGFVNLLRRHVSYRDVLAICLTEWRKSGAGAKYSPARLARAQAVIDAENARPAGERNAIHTYREICQTLNERGAPALPRSNPIQSGPSQSTT